MTPVECPFESEVLSAVLEARWPGRTDAELVAHVAGCTVCSDVVAIAGALENSRVEVGAPGALPDSGLVWWMAQRRARFEAAEAASRPISAAQTIALVCAIAVLCGYFGGVIVRLQATLGRLGSATGNLDVAARFAAATRLLAGHAGLALAMAAVLLLVPAAAYLAIGRE